jgi:hypothetical protein
MLIFGLKMEKRARKLGGGIILLENYHPKNWGIRKNWSRDDLASPQIPDYEVYHDNDS